MEGRISRKADALDKLLREVFRARGETFPLTDKEVAQFSEKVDSAFSNLEAQEGEERIKDFISNKGE